MGKRVPIGVIKTRGVILHEDKIFLCKFDPSVYGAPMSSSFFGLPGGTLDPKETLKAWLSREIMEELGVEAKIWPLVYTQEVIREDSSMFDFWYWIENPADFVSVDLSSASHGHEHLEVGFYTIDEIVLSWDTYKPVALKKLMATWIERGPVFIEMGNE